MNLLLRRTSKSPDGIFSIMTNPALEQVAVSVERAYDREPKIPPGVYKCVRGMHQLEHQKEPFETFEITGVPGHTKVLFHCGNTQFDSEGCVILGRAIVGLMVTDSRVTFRMFMDLQTGLEYFYLTVK